mmetsp:Transcript_15472/g.23031  ORF Transcript_15472/g.23031 Transcript_15472/m.23031 type:complete len:137 (+) Transcript_15472:82-492(+)
MMKLLKLCCVLFLKLSCLDGFVPSHSTKCQSLSCSSVENVEPSANQIEELWRRPKRELLKVGKNGITSKHVRSLSELIKHHSVIRIKVNLIEPSIEDMNKMADELVGEDMVVVGVRPSSRLILIAHSSIFNGKGLK